MTLKLIGSVEAGYYGAFARFTTGAGARLVGAQLPSGWLVTVEPPPDVTNAVEVTRWIGGTSYQPGEIAPRFWRHTRLLDFLDAAGEQHVGGARQRYLADELAAFAAEGAPLLRRWIAEALELDGAARATAAVRLGSSVRRYVVILGIDGERVLEEIRRQPDVEQLMALDNAVVQWSAVELRLPDRSELVHASAVLGDVSSPMQSVPWHRWLWQLARATTRFELVAIVDATLAEVDRRIAEHKVRRRQVVERRDEARRFARLMPAAIVHQLPVQETRVDLSSAALREEDSFHYVAFMAITEAVQALVALDADLPIGAAQLTAMRHVANLALGVLGLPVS